MKKRLDTKETWYYRKILGMPLTEHDEVLENMTTKSKLIFNISERQMRILVHIMRKEDLNNLIITRQMEGNSDIGRQRIT